uniref:exo-alpha-sialidase n=1 Tax=Pelodiscus sinensis TaxID=13735 RepID=K7F9X6_PELSI
VSVQQQATLFQAKPLEYRIPALLYIEKYRTILAFAEHRGGARDESADQIVMRRGTYDETKYTVQWEKMQTIVEKPLGDHRPMSPCPVYDEVTGNVVLVFIAVEGTVSEQVQLDKKENKTRLCQVTSADNGVSWGPVKDLTDTDTGSNDKTWATFAVGPGHSFQLNEDKSLVIPAYAYWILDDNTPSPHSFCFVRSDNDHGKTWRRGNYLALNSGECQMVELKSQGKSVLYCNSRSKEKVRVQAVSDNKGRDFKNHDFVSKLVESSSQGCHGSVIGFPRPAGVQSEEDTKWLFSPDLFLHNKPYSKGCFLCRIQTETFTGAAGLLRELFETIDLVYPQKNRSDEVHHLEPASLGEKVSWEHHIPAFSDGRRGAPEQDTWVLYSHPTSSEERKDLGLYLNKEPLNPESWMKPTVICQGFCSYSDLQYMGPGPEGSPLFCCLFEFGKKSECEKIIFFMFTLKDV